MSRCFPYPPLGYTRSKEGYEGLPQFIKVGEEKGKKKKTKTKKKRREKKERASKQSFDGSSSVNGLAAVSPTSSCDSTANNNNNNRKRKSSSSIAKTRYSRHGMELNVLQKLQLQLKLHDDDDATLDDSDWLYQHFAALALTPENKRRRFATDSIKREAEIEPTLQTYSIKKVTRPTKNETSDDARIIS